MYPFHYSITLMHCLQFVICLLKIYLNISTDLGTVITSFFWGLSSGPWNRGGGHCQLRPGLGFITSSRTVYSIKSKWIQTKSWRERLGLDSWIWLFTFTFYDKETGSAAVDSHWSGWNFNGFCSQPVKDNNRTISPRTRLEMSWMVWSPWCRPPFSEATFSFYLYMNVTGGPRIAVLIFSSFFNFNNWY